MTSRRDATEVKGNGSAKTKCRTWLVYQPCITSRQQRPNRTGDFIFQSVTLGRDRVITFVSRDTTTYAELLLKESVVSGGGNCISEGRKLVSGGGKLGSEGENCVSGGGNCISEGETVLSGSSAVDRNQSGGQWGQAPLPMIDYLCLSIFAAVARLTGRSHRLWVIGMPELQRGTRGTCQRGVHAAPANALTDRRIW